MPGRGKAHVLSFFGVVGREFDISRFAVASLLEAGTKGLRQKKSTASAPIHPHQRRCESLKYPEYSCGFTPCCWGASTPIRSTFFAAVPKVVAVIHIETTIRSTGKQLRDLELHLWSCDASGQVAKFRHVADTHQHWLASRV